MTTTNKITDSSDETKEVKIVSEDATGPTEVVLQAGEEHELHIWDDIVCAVQEVDKVEEMLPILGYEQRTTYSKEFYESLHHKIPWQHCKEDIWSTVKKNNFHTTKPYYKIKLKY
mgnify:CR=1 FL=1